MQCKFCGKPVLDRWKMCPYCGKELSQGIANPSIKPNFEEEESPSTRTSIKPTPIIAKREPEKVVSKAPSEVFVICEDLNGKIYKEKLVNGKKLEKFSFAPTEDEIKYLKKITIPKEVKEISKGVFARIHIKEVYIESSVEQWCSMTFEDYDSLPFFIDSTTYFENKVVKDLVTPPFAKRISDYAFCGLESLENLIVMGKDTEIGKYAFSSCVNLKEVTLRGGIKIIDEQAFSGCESLVKINIPSSVTFLGESVFEYCTSLENIYIGDNVKSIPISCFEGCENLLEVEIGSNVKTICEDAFSGCSSLEYIYIPENVKEIKAWAFNECAGLDDVSFDEGLISIGENAFSDCTSLVDISLPDTLESIGEYAFSGCEELESVEAGKNLKFVGDCAFFDCEKLTIYCHKGSVIEEYAQEDDIKVEYIDW